MSLPFGSYFNVYSFGNRYVKMFKSAVEYTDSTLAKAISKIQKMKANLGGTEILKPLVDIFNKAKRSNLNK